MLFENFLTGFLPIFADAASFIIMLPFNLLIGLLTPLVTLAGSIGLI